MNAISTTIVDFAEATKKLARSSGYGGNSPAMMNAFDKIQADGERKARGLRRAFINRLKIINSLDWDEVESFDVEQWKRFRDAPFEFLMKASDDEAAAILDAMGRRLVR